MSTVFRRNTCRLCDQADLELVLQLPATPPVDAYVTRDRVGIPQERYPLDLFMCRTCGHAQLLDVVSPELLFRDYIYVTASSPGLVDHFRQYATQLVRALGISAGAFAVDVGSNDGTLLRFFQAEGLRVLGVDPARDIAQQVTASGIETVPEFFNAEVARKIRAAHGAADLITANNVFAHSDDLAGMAEGVRALIADDGCFVFEVSYLLDMIEGMVYDFIYHEHLCHHSVKPLQRFLQHHGLELIDVRRTPTKGGSLRCVAQPIGGPRTASPAVAEFLARETAIGLDRPEIFQAFRGRVEQAKQRLRELVIGLKDRGHTFAGYGASATSTVLIYHFELGDLLEFIVDDNADRQGRFSPGHHIPVLSGDALYERAPDHVVVLAWRFADLIIGRHEKYQAAGGRFIVPLPELRVV